MNIASRLLTTSYWIPINSYDFTNISSLGHNLSQSMRNSCVFLIIWRLNAQPNVFYIYTTKIDGVVCPPNISETVAGRLMKLAHRPRIASTMIKLISKPILLPILLILVKTIKRIVADPKRKLSPPFDSADSVPSLGHPAPGSGKMLSLFTVLCDYSVWVTETGAPGSGKTIQPIRI